VNIVARAEWGAKPAKGLTNLNSVRVIMCVLHHTTGTYAGPQTVRNIQAFHQGPTRKWADIAYSFLVAPDGTIFEGRGWGKQGAHARGHNSSSIGIAYIGDGRTVPPVEALASIAWLAGEADRRFGTLRRVGHRDVGSTVCPGDALHGWWMGGAALPAVTVPEPACAPEVPSKGVVAEKGEVSAQRISEPSRGIPDLRDGWLRHMARSGWLRKGR
jgi:hypothetical protein